jgi:hypothetical protein
MRNSDLEIDHCSNLIAVELLKKEKNQIFIPSSHLTRRILPVLPKVRRTGWDSAGRYSRLPIFFACPEGIVDVLIL